MFLISIDGSIKQNNTYPYDNIEFSIILASWAREGDNNEYRGGNQQLSENGMDPNR